MINSMQRCRYCGVFVQMGVIEGIYAEAGYQPCCAGVKCLLRHVRDFIRAWILR